MKQTICILTKRAGIQFLCRAAAMVIFTCLAFNNIILAENYFVEGTKWHIYRTPVKPYDSFPSDAKSFIWLAKPTEKLGKECLGIYHQQDFTGKDAIPLPPDLMAYISTDGDKVYFLRPKYADWVPMYDFSLKPGESTEIAAYAFYTDEPRMYTVTCEERRPSADYPGIEEMVMKRTNYPYTDYPAPFTEGEYEYWLVGIGRTTGPYWNIELAYNGSNMRDSIISVQSNGKTICSINNAEILGKASIEDINADTQATEPVGYYDLQGRKVNNPTDGVFIRVQGSKAEKVRL